MIWDDKQNRCVGELMFKTEVIAVRMRRDRIIVVLKNKVHVHRFKDLKLLSQITTVDNLLGLIVQSTDNDMHVLAIPGSEIGQVRIDLYHINRINTIQAHESELSALALSNNGTKLATSSSKGTIIRLWDTLTGLLIREFRRGSDRAEIYSLSININSTLLACSSDKGTVHIFNLAENTHEDSNDNKVKHAGGNRELKETSTGTGTGQGTGTGTGTKYINEHGIVSSESGSFTSSSSSAVPLDNTIISSINTNNTKPLQLWPDKAPNPPAGPAGPSISSPLAYLQSMLPEAVVPKYFSSEWSFAQVRGIEGKSICTFVTGSSSNSSKVHDGTGVITGIGNVSNLITGQSHASIASGEQLVILSSEGIFTKCIIPSYAGDCPRLAVHNFRSTGVGAGTHTGVGGVGVGGRIPPSSPSVSTSAGYGAGTGTRGLAVATTTTTTTATAAAASTDTEDVFASMKIHDASITSATASASTSASGVTTMNTGVGKL